MRKIKFRGYSTYLQQWVYGYYCFDDGVHYILERYDYDRGWSLDYKEVDPESIGEFTGLKDQNGKEIYEGDILKHPRWRSGYKCKKCGHNPKESQTFLVFWQNKWHHDYGYTTVGRWALEVIGGFDEYELNEAEKYEVIGNKFQNPELLDQ